MEKIIGPHSNSTTKAKEQMFETAYSPMYKCFVKINRAHKDDMGKWIFSCSFQKEHSVLFRECELENFVL